MSTDGVNPQASETEEIELQEWLGSLEYILKNGSLEQARKILQQLQIRAQEAGVTLPFTVNTPYVNSISPSKQPPYPGNREIERRIKSIIRWNAMAMLSKPGASDDGGSQVITPRQLFPLKRLTAERG